MRVDIRRKTEATDSVRSDVERWPRFTWNTNKSVVLTCVSK